MGAASARLSLRPPSSFEGDLRQNSDALRAAGMLSDILRAVWHQIGSSR